MPQFFAISVIDTNIKTKIAIVFFCLIYQALVGHDHNGPAIWFAQVAECGCGDGLASACADFLYALWIVEEFIYHLILIVSQHDGLALLLMTLWPHLALISPIVFSNCLEGELCGCAAIIQLDLIACFFHDRQNSV